MKNLTADINAGESINDIVAAYPEISSSYIISTYNALAKKPEKKTKSTAPAFGTPEYDDQLLYGPNE